MAKKKPLVFHPNFTISPTIATGLMRIEAVKQAIQTLPITPRVLANLRETARLFSTHYSTMIEGNRLTQEQVAQVIGRDQHFPGRERDQDEVKGYYAALDEAERIAKRRERVSEAIAQRLHALVTGGGKTRVKATPYRDGQNVIRDAHSNAIVYMPPEAKDVPWLMEQLITWINRKDDLPVPIKGAIAHYQYATIHPYYDGNGRTARLLTSLILHLGTYDLKGLYALEEYYARNLKAYYEALQSALRTTNTWAVPRPTSPNGSLTSLRAWQFRSKRFATKPCAKRNEVARINRRCCATCMSSGAGL